MDLDVDRAWLQAAGVLAGSVVLGYLSRAVILKRLGAVFSRTTTDLDNLLLEATRRHIPYWFILGGVAISARLAPLSDRALLLADRLAAVGLIISVSLAAARLGTSLLERYTREAGATVATTSLAQNVLRSLILGVGVLLILANLGLSITPLLTALGVGSLAVALALQPTLSNLFAGLHIALAHPIRIGDFVQLETGQKGFVEDIGWRAVRLRAQPNNLFIVPNARVAEMVVTNYTLPDPEQTVQVEVGVAYGSDLALVERVTCEVAREVLREVQGGVADFEPFIRFHAFGDSSIGLTVNLRGRSIADQSLITHEFVKKLKARYDREGIEIPFPQRVLHGAAGSAAPRSASSP
jgi:small-conductance mechanosensitive channel